MTKRISAILLMCLVIFTGCSKVDSNNFKTGEEKTFTLCISAPTEEIEKTVEYISAYVYLGDFLDAEGIIEFERGTYGRYIHKADSISDNPDKNLWWTVYVDGESALTGVDDIKIEDGSVYKLELTKID